MSKDNIKTGRDLAYWERNQLVAFLSKLYPAWLIEHPTEDVNWEENWRWIVLIELPTGQATWHIHISEIEYFSHLEVSKTKKWDGHTTMEKYKRIREC